MVRPPSREWSKVFIYASLIFLATWLIRNDYLSVPIIRDPVALALSFLLLAGGFAGSALVWWSILKASKHEVSLQDATASVGLTIFGKYVPGKVWSILGRASYLSERYPYSAGSLAALSLNVQILTLWSGLLLGSLTFFVANTWGTLGWSTLAIWLLLSVVLFSDSVRLVTESIAHRLGRKTVRIPRFSGSRVVRLLPLFLMTWALWGGGFAYLVVALTGATPTYSHALAFILAATVGIISFLAPGGLGVREGVLVFLLAILGVGAKDATTIAVTSRLWFLCGEGFIFLAGAYCYRRNDSADG